MRHLLRQVSRFFPKFVMHGGDHTPYLSRYRIFETPDYRLFLHQFHRGDSDREVHNHPWSWAMSLILSGGYEEECVVEGLHLSSEDGWLLDALHTTKRFFGPGSVNWIDTETYHRVTLPHGEAWSLILSGPKTASWGFVRLSDWKYTPWREFIRQKGLDPKEGPSRWSEPETTLRREVEKWLLARLNAYAEAS